MIKPMTISEYNDLVDRSRVIDQPVLDGISEYVRTTYSEDHCVEIFQIYNAIVIYHHNGGDVTTVYERPF